MEEKKVLSRRGFFGLAGAAAVVAGAGLVGCSQEGGSATGTEIEGNLPDSWDQETDVVVVGYGGAGIAAAITIKTEALGDVIVLEAAPPESEGGNTRVSGNIVFIPDDVESAVAYQTAMNEDYIVEPELIKAWAEEVVKNKDWVGSLGGTMEQIPVSNPEFPELPGADKAHVYCVDAHFGDQSLWDVLKEQEASLGYQVIHNARAVELVRNSKTNEALGVIAEQDGKRLAVKARKGVILSCGGFENNPEMLRNYYDAGSPKIGFFGTPYNRGDGFKLIEPFGAQLWHMNSFSGPSSPTVTLPDNEALQAFSYGFASKDFIFVGRDGSRFIYEETANKNHHGKLRFSGVWQNLPAPQPIHVVFGQKAFTETPSIFVTKMNMIYAFNMGLVPEKSNQDWVDDGFIIKADTIEELAAKTGKNPEVLAATIATYNGFCAAGKDPEFHRGDAYYEYGDPNMTGQNNAEATIGASTEKQVVIQPFALVPLEGPFYAFELTPCLINTQGGPKRNAKGQLVDSSGKGIGRLYGAGEFGVLYSYLYNGGGNVSEAIASGRIAARSAAAEQPWDA